jgi:DNA-binding response OmpR family regulator
VTLPSILIVDDDAALRSTVVNFLREEGFVADGVSDGRSALSYVEGRRPDVVVLDLHLPRMDGWNVARSIKERGIHSKIIVLTAAHSARAAAEQLGADGYVAKPFALLQLLRAIEQLDDAAA